MSTPWRHTSQAFQRVQNQVNRIQKLILECSEGLSTLNNSLTTSDRVHRYQLLVESLTSANTKLADLTSTSNDHLQRYYKHTLPVMAGDMGEHNVDGAITDPDMHVSDVRPHSLDGISPNLSLDAIHHGRSLVSHTHADSIDERPSTHPTHNKVSSGESNAVIPPSPGDGDNHFGEQFCQSFCKW